MFKRFKPFYELTKSSIVYLVLVTTAFGYYLGSGEVISYHFFWTLFSTALVCGGVCGLNQVIEWKDDIKMERTKIRPIPRGAISPKAGLFFSASLTITGLVIMFFLIAPLLAFGGLVTGVLYLFIYTPLKKITWLNTMVGAIPGSLPPMGGWLAAAGEIELGAWLLFLLLFFWQHPHFYIIAWMCQKDYLAGGFKMLPSVKPVQGYTFVQILVFSVLLVVASLMLIKIESLNTIYLVGAILLGFWFLAETLKIYRDRSTPSAKRFLRITVFYLPILFGFALLDSLL